MMYKNGTDLTDLTPGELLRIARRRAGLTQRQAAAQAGIGKGAWWAAEKGLGPAPTLREAGLPAVRRLTLPELLDLARRRSGLGLTYLTKAGSVSRPTLLAMERRGETGLKAFWEKRGFRF